MYIGEKKHGQLLTYHIGINAYIFSFLLVEEINVQLCITILHHRQD